MGLYVVAAAALLCVWPMLRRYITYKWPPVLTSVAVGLLLISVLFEARYQWHNRSLTEAADELAGRSVVVTCQRLSAAMFDATAEAGFLPYDADGATNQIHLKWDTCAELRRYNPANPTIDEIAAVHVLAHEAMHTAGLLSEPEAECAAVQANAKAATLLGATEAQGAALSERYWTEIYPNMPDGYRSSECKAGGALDTGGPAPWHDDEPER